MTPTWILRRRRPLLAVWLVALALAWLAPLTLAQKGQSAKRESEREARAERSQGSPAAAPRTAGEPGPAETPAADLPTGINVEFSQLRQTEDGDYLFGGPVVLTWRSSRIQADGLALRDKRFVEAKGNVLIVWGENRVFGSRLTYDLELERGTIEDAIGQVQNDYMFWAKSAEKIGDDLVHLKKATVTTCNQPTPYWSFAVSSARIHVDHYARMWNARLRARKLPLIYLPYLIWPVKRDRAAGLLMPEFHTTEDRGNAVTEELFIPLGRSADMTLLGRYYTKAGFGGGGELRFVPNAQGSGYLNGFYIRDKVAGASRYRAEYRQTQKFRNGFRMVADINLVSDFNYFSDFERELNLVSSPTILTRVEFSRNGPWTSMNVRELRREQLFSDQSSLVQSTLPEVEWRGRSRKLGKSPFYLSYEASLASIQQHENPAPCLEPPCTSTAAPLDVDYARGDVYPTITVPLSPAPWMDITPRVNYRATYYTQKRVASDRVKGEAPIEDESITRQLWGAGIDFVGPKIYRIYERPKSQFSPKFKHTIEPRLSYGVGSDFDRSDELILYDDVDRFSGGGNQASYGIVQRLFAARPRARPGDEDELESGSTDAGRSPDGATTDGAAEPAAPRAAGAGKEDAPLETVEVATFEIRQSRSFERDDISRADLDRDGVIDTTSPYSSVDIIGRFNPSPSTSLDLRSSFDILYKDFNGATLSGSLRGKLARLRFSLVHRNPLAPVQATEGSKVPYFRDADNDTQVRLTAGLSLFRGKLQIDVDGSYDADPIPGQRHVPDRRWRIQYHTQCCTFLLERLNRNFSSLTDRQDFYFRIDLKGVGKLVDFKY